MGAQVQCGSGNYFPGYYSMKDLNEDAISGSWSQFHENKMLTRGQYYNNGFTLRPTVGHSDYDKEVLKQTMLKHEAIFKKQVYELHRLYRIQKDLMNDLKKKEFSKYPFPAEMTEPGPFSFQMESEGIQNSWQMLGMPVARSSVYAKPSISVADTIQSPLKFPKEGSQQVGSIPSQNGVKDCELLKSKVKKFPRKMFDLQLPADEYIDSEESELIEDEKIPENEVKLTLGTGSVHGLEGDGWKVNSHSQNCFDDPKLVDLNESNQGSCIKEATTSSLINFPNSSSSHEEFRGAQLSWKPNASFHGPPMDFFLYNQKDRDHKTCLNILHAEHEGSKREWLPFNLEAGKSKSNGNSFTRDFGHDRGPTSSEPLQLGFKKDLNLPSFLLPDQRQTETWFRKNLDCGVEISETIPNPTKSNYEGLTVPPLTGSFPFFSESDDTEIGTPSVSSWRNSSLNQSPLVVQALPCYKGAAGINMPRQTSNFSTQNAEVSGDKWHLNSNLRSNPGFTTEALHQNGFAHGIKSESYLSCMQVPPICLGDLNLKNSDNSCYEHYEDLRPRKLFKALHCEDVKSVMNMSLNLALSNGFGDKGSLRRDLELVDKEGTIGHLSEIGEGIFNDCMNSKRETQMDSGFSQDYSQLIPCGDAENPSFQTQFKRETGPSLGFMPSFSQSLPSKTEEIQTNGLSDSTMDRVFLDKPHISKERCNSCPSSNTMQDNFKTGDSEKNLKIGLLKGEFSSDLKLPDLARQLSVDLNMEIAKTLTDLQQTQLEILSTVEADLAPEADPKSTGLPENIPLGGEYLETNRVVTPVKLLACDQNPHEDSVASTAAKTIVAMSSGTCEKSNNVTCCPWTDLRDSLDWFSEVVVSNGGNLEHVEGVCNDDFECSDGLDFFEFMTLRLSEMKIDEFLCQPRTQDEEGKGSVLNSQSSRGRLCRRRQRRDFQREILPGIASLSRHEVTEDLQTIGGLMRASGCAWPPGRGVGRNDCLFLGRGRRRARCGSAVGNSVVGSALQETGNGEPDPQGRSLKGIPWGKTTRRRRMQRVPAGTSCTPLI